MSKNKGKNADGIVKIVTEIDTDGVKDGLKEIDKGLKNIKVDSFKELDKDAKKAAKSLKDYGTGASKTFKDIDKSSGSSKKNMDDINKTTTKSKKDFKQMGHVSKNTFDTMDKNTRGTSKNFKELSGQAKSLTDSLGKGADFKIDDNIDDVIGKLSGLGAGDLGGKLGGTLKGLAGPKGAALLAVTAASKAVIGEFKKMNDAAIRITKEITKTFEDAFKVIGKKAATLSIDMYKTLGKESIDFVKGSVELGIDYDYAKSEVEAIGGFTEKEMKRIDKLSKELGANTAYSATQAMEAAVSLTRKGLNMDEIEGILGTLVDGAIGFKQEIDFVADGSLEMVNQMGLEVNDLEDILNKASYATANSSSSFDELVESMKEAGPALSGMGTGIDSAFTLISLLKDAGTAGGAAGTTIKAMTLDLQKAADKYGKVAVGIGKKKIKVDLFDEKGNYRDILDILTDIDNITKNMTDKQKSKALDGIFERQSSKGFAAFSKAGLDGVNTLRKGINETEAGATGLDKAFKRIADKTSTKTINKQKIAFKDNNGQMRESKDIAYDIVKATEGMTKKQRDAALGVSFYGDELKDVIKLADGGKVAFERMWAETGATLLEKQAFKINDNLKGALLGLESSYDAIRLSISNIATPDVKDTVTFITSHFQEVAEIIENEGIEGLDKAAVLLADMVTTGLSDAAPNMEKVIGKWTDAIVLFFEEVGKDPKKVGDAIYTIGKSIGESFAKVTPLILNTSFDVFNSILDNMIANKDGEKIGKWGSDVMTNLFDKLSETIPKLTTIGLDIVEGFLDGFNENEGQIEKTLTELFENIGKIIEERLPELKPKFEQAVETFLNLKNIKIKGVGELEETIKKDVLDVLAKNAGGFLNNKWDSFKEDMKTKFSGLPGSIWTASKSAWEQLSQNIFNKTLPTGGYGGYMGGPSSRSVEPSVRMAVPMGPSLDSEGLLNRSANLMSFTPDDFVPEIAVKSKARAFANATGPNIPTGRAGGNSRAVGTYNGRFTQEDIVEILNVIAVNTATLRDTGVLASKLTPHISDNMMQNGRRG